MPCFEYVTQPLQHAMSLVFTSALLKEQQNIVNLEITFSQSITFIDLIANLCLDVVQYG